jgi:holliday junction DNA helicase RuvA
MIAKIIGTVEHIYEDSLIVLTQGLGYQILSTKSVLSKASIGQTISLFVSSQIREQQYILFFGFETHAEKATFTLLQSVSGVGTKMAMSMLSHFSPNDLSNAIIARDKALLTSIAGIGPKLADRIILELKNKISTLPDCQVSTDELQTPNSDIIDAALALTTLGINYTDALEKVRNAQKQSQVSSLSLEDLIKLSLK